MYVKTTTRKVKGGEVRYLHLAHNEWDAAGRRSVPKLLYSFGREARVPHNSGFQLFRAGELAGDRREPLAPGWEPPEERLAPRRRFYPDFRCRLWSDVRDDAD